MDAGTVWLVVAGLLTAVGTWALALATWWLAKKTKQLADAATDSAWQTAQSLEPSLLIQELAALTPLLDDENENLDRMAERLGAAVTDATCLATSMHAAVG
jgi:hypothetical protein